MNQIILSIFLFALAFSSEANVIKYPQRAQNLRIDGEVSVLYDIDQSGKVSNIRLIKAEPPYVFDRSVRKQISYWNFTPGEPRKDELLNIIFKAN